jgi:hypothetical protein
MAPVQRADVEYEFDIYADMDATNTMIIQKSRCSTLNSQIIAKPDGGLAEVIGAWLAGAPEQAPISASPEQQAHRIDQSVRDKLNDLYARAKKLGCCTTDRQFVSYIRHVLQNPQLLLQAVTLAELARVEDDLVAKEMAETNAQEAKAS